MVEVIHDEKLLIHHIHDSLVKPTLNWYIVWNGSEKKNKEMKVFS
jgi:hypothetical protein